MRVLCEDCSHLAVLSADAASYQEAAFCLFFGFGLGFFWVQVWWWVFGELGFFVFFFKIFFLGFWGFFFPLPVFPAFESPWVLYVALALLHESLPGEPALQDTAALPGKGPAGTVIWALARTGYTKLFCSLFQLGPVPALSRC